MAAGGQTRRQDPVSARSWIRSGLPPRKPDRVSPARPGSATGARRRGREFRFSLHRRLPLRWSHRLVRGLRSFRPRSPGLAKDAAAYPSAHSQGADPTAAAARGSMTMPDRVSPTATAERFGIGTAPVPLARRKRCVERPVHVEAIMLLIFEVKRPRGIAEYAAYYRSGGQAGALKTVDLISGRFARCPPIEAC